MSSLWLVHDTVTSVEESIRAICQLLARPVFGSLDAAAAAAACSVCNAT